MQHGFAALKARIARTPWIWVVTTSALVGLICFIAENTEEGLGLALATLLGGMGVGLLLPWKSLPKKEQWFLASALGAGAVGWGGLALMQREQIYGYGLEESLIRGAVAGAVVLLCCVIAGTVFPTK